MECKPCSPEEFIEDVVGFAMAVGKAAADDMDSEVLVKFGGRQGQVLEVLHHLVSWERDASLEVSICEAFLAFLKHSVGPCEDGGDEDEDLGLGVGLVDRLSQDLDDLLGFLEVSAAEQVNDDLVASEDTLGECLGLLLDVKHHDGGAWDRNCFLVSLNQGSHEFVRFLGLTDD